MTDTPHAPIPTRTLINDGEEPLLWIDDLLVLPLGAGINLDNIPGGPEVVDRSRFPSRARRRPRGGRQALGSRGRGPRRAERPVRLAQRALAAGEQDRPVKLQPQVRQLLLSGAAAGSGSP